MTQQPNQHRWGATPQEWEWAAYHAGTDLLPAVGDPDPSLPRTQRLKHLDSLAKVPSLVGPNGIAHGITSWAVHISSPQQVEYWKTDPSLNVLLITRSIRAFDIDIDDVAVADQIEAFATQVLGVQLPVRFRADSGKRTLLMRLAPNPIIRKRVINVAGKGAIEFLANGQQTALFGTHPKGARFQLRHAEAGIPTVEIEKMEALWRALGAYDAKAAPLIQPADQDLEFIMRNGGANSNDPVLVFLEAEGLITGYETNGLVNVKCPNEAEHTTQTGGSSTSYLPAGVGGKEQGGFKCLHSHCQHINTPAFLHLIGFEREQAATAFMATTSELPTAPVMHPVAGLKPGELSTVELLSSAVCSPVPDGLGLQRDNKGNILKNFSNLCDTVRSDPGLIRIKYDTFMHNLSISLGRSETFKPLDDDDISFVREAMERKYRLSYSAADVSSAISAAARGNSYDSAIEWLNKQEWDGVDRLTPFAEDILKTYASDYHTAVAHYMWVAMACRILEPGVKADMAPIFISPGQGTGKSTLVKKLVPFEDWHGELDLAERDDNTARIMRGKVAIELPELKGLNSRDAESIKAFMSRAEEEYIPKYKEFAQVLKRRCIFFGTDNRTRMLSDPSGNRRMLPVHVAVTAKFVDHFKMAAELNQYWAQAAALAAKFGSPLEAVEHYSAAARGLASDALRGATILDPWYTSIREFMDQQAEGTLITLRAIAVHLLPGGVSGLDHYKAKRIRDTLTVIGVPEIEADVWKKPHMSIF